MILGVLLMGIWWLGGCATEGDFKFKTVEEHYQSVLERQKAGLDSGENSLERLPEQTVEEYERLGDAYVEQDKIGFAIIQYNKALEMDPGRIQIRYKVGILLLKNRKPQEAQKQFEQILAQDVMFAPAHLGLGQALLQLGDDLGADQQFRRALKYDSQLWKAHNYLGILADRRHLHLSAIEAYQAALAIEPKEPSVLNNLGMAYYMNGQYQEAVKSFHLALRAGAEDPKIANNLGLALSKLGRYSEAFDAFRKSTSPAMAYNNIGVALLEAGTADRAISCFQKAIDLEPTYYEKANQNLSYARRVLHNEKIRPQKRLSKTVCF